MTIPPSEKHAKPVLGLFANESQLRDHIAANLDLVETGLTLLRTEYGLDNPDSAGGRIDILARDAFDHVICMEIKRSDNSARSTLNELGKYVTLLVERDRVPKEMVRCIVVSTHWSELLLPLSYFAYASSVDVTALQAIVEDGAIILRPVALKPLQFLPQLSPDMDLIRFEAADPRQRYADFILARAAQIPFVRLALFLFAAKPTLPDGRPAFPMVVCVWRVPDGLHERIEAVTGKKIGSDFPYAAPGWEPEADAKNWIGDVPHEDLPEFAHGWTHGTPEKLQSLDTHYTLDRVIRVGDWPKIEAINDDARLLKAALAVSPLGGSGRANRNSFRAIVSPTVATSWAMAVEAFLDFIAFEPRWQAAACTYLEQLAGANISVELHAFDKKHFLYAVHQARFHPDAMLGYFEIVCRAGDTVFNGLHGYYTWDGGTCPYDAEAAVYRTYGDEVRAMLAIWSAVDLERYEIANTIHGFLPVIDWLDETGTLNAGRPAFRHTLQDFVRANPDYCAQVSAVLERCGELPTDPSG
jgi:hypothetical protein